MTRSDRKPAPSPRGTTRSPADRDIFGDGGPEVPIKDLPPEQQDRTSDSSEAGGVD